MHGAPGWTYPFAEAQWWDWLTRSDHSGCGDLISQFTPKIKCGMLTKFLKPAIQIFRDGEDLPLGRVISPLKFEKCWADNKFYNDI